MRKDEGLSVLRQNWPRCTRQAASQQHLHVVKTIDLTLYSWLVARFCWRCHSGKEGWLKPQQICPLGKDDSSDCDDSSTWGVFMFLINQLIARPRPSLCHSLYMPWVVYEVGAMRSCEMELSEFRNCSATIAEERLFLVHPLPCAALKGRSTQERPFCTDCNGSVDLW